MINLTDEVSAGMNLNIMNMALSVVQRDGKGIDEAIEIYKKIKKEEYEEEKA